MVHRFQAGEWWPLWLLTDPPFVGRPCFDGAAGEASITLPSFLDRMRLAIGQRCAAGHQAPYTAERLANL